MASTKNTRIQENFKYKCNNLNLLSTNERCIINKIVLISMYNLQVKLYLMNKKFNRLGWKNVRCRWRVLNM